MNQVEIPQIPNIPSDVDAFIERYSPRIDYSGQWDRLRQQILELVRRLEPATNERATDLLCAFGPLLALAAETSFDGPLTDLLVDEGIVRVTVSLNSTEVTLARVQNVRSLLTQLHRVLHDLPPVIPDEPQKRVASEPFTAQDFSKLMENLHEPANALHLHVIRRLILALGAGLIGEKAEKARIYFNDRGITAIVDGNGNKRPLSKNWIAQLGALMTIDLELYEVPKGQIASVWLRGRSFAHLWPRLRDEWLLEQLDGVEPAFVQLRRTEATVYDLDRIVLRWETIPLEVSEDLLRKPTNVPNLSACKLLVGTVPINPQQRGLEKDPIAT